MIVKDTMSTHLVFVASDTTLQDCARTMRDKGVGVLLVRDNGTFVGILTDRDICCRAVGDGLDPTTTTARDIMTDAIESCLVEDDCTVAAFIMQTKHLRRLAVMDRQQTVVGLLSVDDLAPYSNALAGAVIEAAAPWRH